MSPRQSRFRRTCECCAGRRRFAASLAILALLFAGASCAGPDAGSEEDSDVRQTLPASPMATSGGASEPRSLRRSGSEREYDRAVARMTTANHVLEQRQADLYFARKDSAPASLIADLRREVASLERQYADAIEAMIEASRCKAYCSPEGTDG